MLKSRRSLKYFSSSYTSVVLVDSLVQVYINVKQWSSTADWQDGILTVVYHMPIRYRSSPEWRRASAGFRYRRSGQRAETRRGLPAVNEKRTTEVYAAHANTRTHRREHGKKRICSAVAEAGNNGSNSPQWPWRDPRESIGGKLPTEALYGDGRCKSRRGTRLIRMWPDLLYTQTVSKQGAKK